MSGNTRQARLFFKEARAAGEDKVEPGSIDWNLDYLRALETPSPVPAFDPEKLAGSYQARQVQFKDGQLQYFRQGGRYPNFRRLIPLTRDTFRLKFEFDANGNPLKAVELYEEGSRDETMRDK